MPPLTPSAIRMCHSLFALLFFLGLVAVAFRNTELDEALKDFLLRHLRRFVARLLQLGCAAALNLTRPQGGENHKAIFTVDVIGNGNQARPPNEAMISSMRPCCRRGTAVPLRTIDSRSRM